MNQLIPGYVQKINTSGGQFKMMENINKFQEGCKKYGVPEIDVFQTVDLWERRNIPQVTQCIFALGRTVRIIRCLLRYRSFRLFIWSLWHVVLNSDVSAKFLTGPDSSWMARPHSWSQTFRRKQTWIHWRTAASRRGCHQPTVWYQQRRQPEWHQFRQHTTHVNHTVVTCARPIYFIIVRHCYCNWLGSADSATHGLYLNFPPLLYPLSHLSLSLLFFLLFLFLSQPLGHLRYLIFHFPCFWSTFHRFPLLYTLTFYSNVYT